MLITPAAARAPLVSVVWNVRGRAAAAKETIVALQAQSYQNFELVLIEDGPSTDEGRKAIRALAAKDGRIRLLPRIADNAGESLLYLLRRCRGDYVAIYPAEGRLRPD